MKKLLVPYRPQRGSGLPVFRGMAVQSERFRGMAVQSGLIRNVVLPGASTVGKSFVRKGLKTASGVLNGVAEDYRAFMDEILTTQEQPLRTRTQHKFAKMNEHSQKRPINKDSIKYSILLVGVSFNPQSCGTTDRCTIDCTIGSVDLFSTPPAQTSIMKRSTIEFPPIANVGDEGHRDFYIPHF